VGAILFFRSGAIEGAQVREAGTLDKGTVSFNAMVAYSMIRKSGNRFSEKIMLNKNDPEKWKPVFRKDHAQSKCSKRLLRLAIAVGVRVP
jgi:hypothetical protein